MKPDEALWQENQQLKERIIVLEQWVKGLQAQLMDRPPAMQRSLEFRSCAYPDCDASALVDKETLDYESYYCPIHARARRRQNESD